MDSAALLATGNDDARGLLAAAREGWDRPVPGCGDWDAAALVRHTGAVLGSMAGTVATGTRTSRKDIGSGPEGLGELPGWYLGHLDRALEALGSADPDAETWTFSSTGDRRVAWWCRRLAVEIALHRVDAQSGAPGGVGPIDGDVAAAGIEEYVTELLPGVLTRAGADGGERPTGTLHLHATDGDVEWWVDLDDPGAAARPEHAKADTALRATRSDLLLWLWNRAPAEAPDVFGDPATLDRWHHLTI